MRWLLFLSRLAFVCNCFFVLAVSLQLARWFRNEDAEALTLIIGYAMAAVLNPAAVVSYIILFLFNRQRLQVVPLWLRIVNTLFLALQVVYLLFLNAQ